MTVTPFGKGISLPRRLIHFYVCPVVASDDEGSDGSDDEAEEGEDEEDGDEDGQDSDEGEEAGGAGTGGEGGNRKRRREPGGSPRQRRRRSPGEREAARQAERAERLQRRKERAQVGSAGVGRIGVRRSMAQPHGSGVTGSRLRLRWAWGHGQVVLQQSAARDSDAFGRLGMGPVASSLLHAIRRVPVAVQAVDAYYSERNGYGKPSSVLLYGLCNALQQDDFFHVWWVLGLGLGLDAVGSARWCDSHS